MKLKTFLLIALALCICTDASAQARKKKMKEDVKTEKNLLQPVPADTFSYAMGVAQSESLKQFLKNSKLIMLQITNLITLMPTQGLVQTNLLQ